MKFATKAIHAGVHPDPTTGAIMTPIYQTSTYVQDGVGNHKGYEYSRTLNPTRHALEKNIAAVENGKHGACFGSGLAAIDCVIKMLNPGDEIISTNDLYGGSYRIFNTIFAKYGLIFHFVDMQNPAAVEALVNENTKLIWVETPTNPMMNIIDIEAMAQISKKAGALLCVDNTFATPYLQNPLDLGADMVMHSVTKYLGGHSDVVMGALVCNDDDLATEMYRIQNSSGAVTAPMDSFLVLRGIKTLHLRMQRHCENGEKIARYLQTHPKVDKVYWPGFETHPNHDVAKKQMRGFGGMISFTLKGNQLQDALDLVKKVEIFALAESLGGVESLIGHPATMTHASIPKEVREQSGVVDSLIRLSVGVEDAEDLIADLESALK
ncbi:MAG: cystathionine gamma-synthase [Crocinitomicaceae bacterium]|jgi:cystathionine beta-lyase/cystathionine gamma-synthase|nr:cystathionine gamma-synthase [Crocinitomicaceae bacterium]MDP4723658.1 cystathionine gamma-synthase [Crocinitomicaceae bacterium]MDP4738555.1 cystathionine gamma-synthase [Crocinitomicaceae bacterium]MDP4798655.1 cystathionine gamma-synthase [Crocinitomicaceae bacterium]MDP4806384.1 cystathionine gamma-synthase [Crocinitomicaceae bacterium]